MKTKRTKTALVLLSIIIGILLSGCDGIVDSSSIQDIDDSIRSMKSFNQPEEKHSPAIFGPIEEGDSAYPDRPANFADAPDTRAYKIIAAPGYDEMMLYNPASDAMWIGSVIDGNSITTGEYRPVTVARGPLTFSTSIAATTQSQSVPVASLSAVREATTQIITSDLLQSSPANSRFDIEYVYSEEQLQLAMQTNFRGFGVKASAGFDFTNTEIKTRILIRFLQQYYTIDMDIPENPSDLFASATGWNALSRQISGDISPVVISSVKYGRMAVFMVESSESEEKVRASFDAAYSNALFGASAGMSAEHSNIIQNSSVKGFVYGGESGSASTIGLGEANDIVSNFISWLKIDGNLTNTTPVAPLAYTMRYLKDWSVSRVVLGTEYWKRVVPESEEPADPPETSNTVKISSVSVYHNFEIPQQEQFGGYQGPAEFRIWIEGGSHDSTTNLITDPCIINVPFKQNIHNNPDIFLTFQEETIDPYIIVYTQVVSSLPSPPVGKKIYLCEFNSTPDKTMAITFHLNHPDLSFIGSGTVSITLTTRE